MGMFDYVDYKMKCPNCRNVIDSFQTKFRPPEKRYMMVFDIKQLPKETQFYSSCHKCGTSVVIVKEHYDFIKINSAKFMMMNNKVRSNK